MSDPSMSDIPRYPCVHVEVGAADVEIAQSLLWDAGATGLEERDATTIDGAQASEVLLVAHFDDEEGALAAVAELSARWPARLEHIVGDAWRDGWKAFFKPTRIGERLVVRPSWEPFDARPDDVVLLLDPGQAFGTGTHETTRLVLAEVEARVVGGEDVLDVGCGSGILGIAAMLFDARRVVAIDVDPIAVRVALENAEANAVSIEASTDPIDAIEGRYSLVLANIRCPILVPMAEALTARLAKGGTLVLSGLLVTEEEEMRAAYDGLARFESRRVDGEWLALVYRGLDVGLDVGLDEA